MEFSKNAQELLETRYLQRNPSGGLIESVHGMFQRVAEHVASAESHNKHEWAQHFYEVMERCYFLPNSPTLMHAGLVNGQLSACFVLPVEDHLKGIFHTMAHTALIHQQGGGTGFNFSQLRPQGDLVSSSGKFASGPLAFLELYDTAVERVKKGARRSGANMGVLNVDHPDIEAFIQAKSTTEALQNFNLSVGISDAYMRAMVADRNWDLINPRDGKVVKTLPARALWEQLVEQAWLTGDPGLLFLDTINKGNPLPNEAPIQCTNPCGEVPLVPYGSCNLGSLNVSRMIKVAKGRCSVDWGLIERTVTTAIRFLDNVISVNTYPIPEIEARALADRKVGLGIMGWAEMLLRLELSYASNEAVQLAEQLMAFIRSASYAASRSLGRERGLFPNWENSIFYPDMPLRNASCNSIAPTGSISIIANTSYSIEPLYALAYRRVGVLGGKIQEVMSPIVMDLLEKYGLLSDELLKTIGETGSIQSASKVPEDLRRLFLTSMEIPWKYHLRHQRAFQQYTDNAVAKTVNLATGTPKRTISQIYRKAWELGLKGITVYRDGSRGEQVLQACRLNGMSCW